MKKLFYTLFIFALSVSASGQNPEHFRWMEGTWKGPGFGGTFEEVWSSPDANGHMMGMFRYSKEDKVVFFEFWVLTETGLKLRHFNPDFTAWEEKDKFIDFSMIETTETMVKLKSLIYERIGDNEMKISLNLKQEGEVRTEVFLLIRQ